MNNLSKVALIALTLTAPIFAQESGVTFYHKDWAVACDNTLTCRIGGHARQAEAGGLLLTRQAGENTTTLAEVILAERMDNEAPVKKLTLWLDGKPTGELTAAAGWALTETQTRAVIDAIKGSGKVELRGGHEPFVLSGEGAYAALLKVDDVQGRIGTPGAWVKQGDKPESSVAQAIPMPVILKVKTSDAQPHILTKAEAKTLTPQLLTALNSEQGCPYLSEVGEEDINGNIIRGDIIATPLDETHTLLSTFCSSGAYNQSYGYWVTDKTLKARPVAVTDGAQNYRHGVITNVFLGSSAGSCASKEEWIWDGEAFRQSQSTINDGCWFSRSAGDRVIPTLVTEVKHED